MQCYILGGVMFSPTNYKGLILLQIIQIIHMTFRIYFG